MSPLAAQLRHDVGVRRTLSEMREQYFSLKSRFFDRLWETPDGAELAARLSGETFEPEGLADHVFATPRSIALYWEIVRAVELRHRHVLVVGERGVGKEAIARIIAGELKSSVVSVNCATLPESVADALLFGVEGGAGIAGVPKQGTMGFVGEADAKVLFLDEFFDAAESVFPKLLRLLEQRDWVRVGATMPTRLDDKTFIVAATNRVTTINQIRLGADADSAVQKVRSDIIDRFGVWLEVAPLRERREEIPALARSLIHRAIREGIGAGGVGVELDIETERHLRDMDYGWPGNVRELRRLLLEQVRYQWNVVREAGVLKIDPLALTYWPGRAAESLRAEPQTPLSAWTDGGLVRRLRREQLVATLRVEMLRSGESTATPSWVAERCRALLGVANPHQAIKATLELKISEIARLVSGESV